MENQEVLRYTHRQEAYRKEGRLMKLKRTTSFLITILLGACMAPYAVYSEELSAGDELEEFWAADYDILSAGDAEGESQGTLLTDSSDTSDYWAGSDGPYIQAKENSLFHVSVVIPENRELSVYIDDGNIVVVKGKEHYESDTGGEYVTKLTLTALKAGTTFLHVYDGKNEVWTYEISVAVPSEREPRIANINDTTVSGISDLVLKPGTYYPITVHGAGTENHDPVEGDTRWVPLYWKEESGTDLRINWRFGTVDGLNEESRIPILIYLQEQQYDEVTGDWEATGSVGNITAVVTTSAWYDPYKVDQPTLIAAYNGAKGIGIKFYKEEGALEYLIYRKYSGVWSYVCSVKANDPGLQFSGETIMYTDTSVAAEYGKGYIYSVAAKREEYITTYDTKGAAIYRLTPPALTKITNSEAGTAVVAWNGVFGNTETNGAYDLQYAEYKDGKTGEFRSVTALPGYGYQMLSTAVSGLTKGSRYVFRIRCSKTNKDRGTYYSEYSRWLSVTINK